MWLSSLCLAGFVFPGLPSNSASEVLIRHGTAPNASTPGHPLASCAGNRRPLKLPQASEEIAALLHAVVEGRREVAGGAAASGLVLLTHGECPHFHRRPVTSIACFHRFGNLSACCRQFDSDTDANPRGEVTATSPSVGLFSGPQICREH